MGIHDEALQKALWQKFNEGVMPVGLRIAYKAFYTMTIEDQLFYDKLVYRNDGPPSYEGLPIAFDLWHNRFHIETEQLK